MVICALTRRSTPTVFERPRPAAHGARNRLSNYYTARSRQDLNIDTRTATEYGVVRTYFDASVQLDHRQLRRRRHDPGQHDLFEHASVRRQVDGLTSQGSLGVYQRSSSSLGSRWVRRSPSDAPWVNYPANNFDSLVGGSGMVTGVNQFTYTAQFGNGVSGTLSAQDVGVPTGRPAS